MGESKCLVLSLLVILPLLVIIPIVVVIIVSRCLPWRLALDGRCWTRQWSSEFQNNTRVGGFCSAVGVGSFVTNVLQLLLQVIILIWPILNFLRFLCWTVLPSQLLKRGRHFSR